MTQTITGVLKGSRIRMAEPALGTAPAAPEASECGSGARARIVEQTPRGALVEVVCECGKVIHLQCVCGGSAPGGEGTT